MTNNIEQRVKEFINEHDMISAGDYLIVGVSGGADSICLLSILNKLKSELNFEIVAVHVNHMLRGEEAERDKLFVKGFCNSLKIPCQVVNMNVALLAEKNRMSVEEAGRMARYRSFDLTAQKIYGGSYTSAKVAVAHHADDNVETVLLNLIRGTGMNGLKGIVPVGKRNRMTIIRPLLSVSRMEILDYLEENGLQHVEDSTNSVDEYSRNKIRLNVIPELKMINSRASEHINDTAQRLLRINEYFDRVIHEAVLNVVDRRDSSVAIEVKKFKELDGAIAGAVILEAIGMMAGTQKDITHVHVRDVESLADKQTGKRIELPYGLEALRSYSNIIITKNEKAYEKGKRQDFEDKEIHESISSFASISVNEIEKGPREFVLADGGKITFKIYDVTDETREAFTEKNIYTKYFDCDKIKGTLVLGRPQSEDVIRFSGGSKSLKKYFVDEKIPQKMRSEMLVLKDFEGVLWVLGYRIGEQYKISSTTKRALEVSVLGGNDVRND